MSEHEQARAEMAAFRERVWKAAVHGENPRCVLCNRYLIHRGHATVCPLHEPPAAPAGIVGADDGSP